MLSRSSYLGIYLRQKKGDVIQAPDKKGLISGLLIVVKEVRQVLMGCSQAERNGYGVVQTIEQLENTPIILLQNKQNREVHNDKKQDEIGKLEDKPCFQGPVRLRLHFS
jgi:hypothetical protein